MRKIKEENLISVENQSNMFLGYIFVFYMHGYFACMHVCALCTCSAIGARRGHQITVGTGTTENCRTQHGAGNQPPVKCL